MARDKRSSKNIIIKLIVITTLILLTTILGISYAYFSVPVNGNEEASSIQIVTARLSLIYTDLQIMSGDNLYPGWSQTKTITVENNGTVTVNYDIFWREILNTVTNDELVIRATCVSNMGTCDNISEMPIRPYVVEEENVLIQSRIPIDPGEKHTYQVTVEFKEIGSDQDYNQGKQFYGTLNIGEGAASHPLYDQIKALAETGTYATTYSGTTNDTYGQVGSKKVYYIKPKTDGDATELLNKINVKFANFCWQILRTTDTGGIKLIYNGDPDPTTGHCQSPTTEYTHKALVGKQGLANVTMTGDFQYADTFTYNLDSGTFTLVSPHQDNYSTNKGVVGKYTCKSSATTCSTLYYVGTTNLANSTKPYQTSYTIEFVQNSIIGKTPWSTNLTSLAYNGYMYGDAYDHAGATAPSSNSIMGNDVYWNGSNYELRDNGVAATGTTFDNDHHYTCNSTSAICTGGTVRYYYYNNLYILLKNGDDIDTAVNRMLTANTHESLMKKYLEMWYKNNMTAFTSYLERNAIYCYDRRMRDYGGLTKNGDLQAYFEYANYDYVYDLSCGNETDKFSVGNSNARINYPVGLATGPEMLLIGNSTVRNTGQLYYLFSPLVWYNRYAYGRNIKADGDVNSYGINGSGGVRPVITLAPTNNTVTGTGAFDDPYIIR